MIGTRSDILAPLPRRSPNFQPQSWTRLSNAKMRTTYNVANFTQSNSLQKQGKPLLGQAKAHLLSNVQLYMEVMNQASCRRTVSPLGGSQNVE